MKKLSILVPHYHEDEKTIGYLLQSLDMQTCKDFEVIIVNDGNDYILDQKFLDSFNYKITYLIKEHKGISHTRNYALDHATTEYVMFCDADDMFFHQDGIKYILKSMPFEVLVNDFLEQCFGTYVNHENDPTFIHAKVYNREFLINNDIRFRDDISCHEDVYFVSLANCIAKDIKYSKGRYYLWKENTKSISRQKDFIYNTFDIYVKSKQYLIDEFVKRGQDKFIPICVASVLFDSYRDWEHLSHSKKRAVKRFYRANEGYWKALDKKTYNEMVEMNTKRYFKDMEIKKFIEDEVAT